MSDWREIAEQRRWADLPWSLGAGAESSTGETRWLLDRIREDVPLVTVRDGMETTERHARPDEIEVSDERARHLQAAAEILALGELEASVEGEPRRPAEQWASTAAEARSRLGRRDPAEMETDEDDISLRGHVARANEALDHVSWLIAFYREQAADDNEAKWVVEAISEAAETGVRAGVELRAALGKGVEDDLYRRAITYPSEGGRQRRKSIRPTDDADMRRMDQCIAAHPEGSGHFSWAARKVSREIDAQIAAGSDRKPRSPETLRKSHLNWRKRQG